MENVSELRCSNGIKFGELDQALAVLAVKCRSSRCGAGAGRIVIHTFDMSTGEMTGTDVFREPVATVEEGR